MIERWVAIPGYEGRYEVSDFGRVRSWLPWRGMVGPRILAASVGTHGYPAVRLFGKGSKASTPVHHLVMHAFVAPHVDGQVIRHLDGDPLNNRLDNLAYGSPSENTHDCIAHGTHWNASKTACKRGHEFDERNTYIGRDGGRRCRPCRRLKNQGVVA